MYMLNKIVAVFSGGLDSTSLLLRSIATYGEVRAISFWYGQKHVHELTTASAICGELAVDHIIMDVSNTFQNTCSALLQNNTQEIPKKGYRDHAAEDRDAYGGVITSVPARNLLFGLHAAIRAASWGYDTVAMAVHQNDGDFYAYPDCEPEVLFPFAQSLFGAFGKKVKLVFPFIQMKKWEVLKAAATNKAAEEILGKSRSCYERSTLHCGECATCRERKEAYRQAALIDPTKYMK